MAKKAIASSGKFEQKVFVLKHNFQEKTVLPSEGFDAEYWRTEVRSEGDMESLRNARFRTLDGIEVRLEFLWTTTVGLAEMDERVQEMYGVSAKAFEVAWGRKVGRLSGCWHLVGMKSPQPKL